MLDRDPALVRERLTEAGPWLRDRIGGSLDGFFKDPYLLWFVAEDPVRNGTLPPNIADIARAIIRRLESVPSRQAQLDEAMKLVAWSPVAPKCGVQIPLLDVLADAGAAQDGNPENALVNGNMDAARHLLARGAKLTLAAAACLDRLDDARRLAGPATPAERQYALVLACLRGVAPGIRLLLDAGADPSGPSAGLMAHGTPLHHAVYSGSLESVRILVEAGADLARPDTLWHGTPLGWAGHMRGDEKSTVRAADFARIEAYLRERDAPS